MPDPTPDAPSAADPLPRRAFLQSAAAGLVGAALLPRVGGPAPDAQGRPPQIAVQLYTVRDALEQDLAGTLRRVAAMGYDTVETAFWPKGVTLTQAATALRAAGVRVCSAHVELPIDAASRQVFLDTAGAFGCTRMIWHGWPEDRRYGSVQGTQELVAIYNEASRFAQANGLQFGLHNHWWEFRNRVGDGTPFDIVLAGVVPEIFFEIDTYWVKVAGQVPADLLRRLGPRATLIHMKDGPARWNDALATDNPDPMTAVGRGTQDVRAIARAALGHLQFMVVEMDKTQGDVFAALHDSYDFLVGNRLARGAKPPRRTGRA